MTGKSGTDVPKKKWYRSKTLWLNLAASALLLTEGLSYHIQGLTPFFDPATLALITFGLGVVNVVLRTITTQGVEK
jgi:hypothetical protein